MSLINDALRRAGQAKKNPGTEPSSGAPMQPVHPPAKSGASPFGPILFVLIAVVMIVAGWFFLKGWRNRSQPGVTATAPNNSSNAEAMVPPSERGSQPVLRTAVELTPIPAEATPPVVAANESTNTSATNSAESNAAVAAATIPVPPALKLQGIFFRLKNPSAMINGKSVMVGESVAGARVTKIERQEVRVERDGKTLVLTLP